MPSFFQKVRSFFLVSDPQPEPVAERSLENPSTPITSETLGAARTGSKVRVVDAEEAMAITAFWRAINILSGVIASLPFSVYRVEGDVTEKLPKHPISKLIGKYPSQLCTKFDFFQTLVLHLCVYGNFYARIDRSQNTGLARALTILPPDQVRIEYNSRGGVVYVYTERQENQIKGQEYRYAFDRVVHVSGLSWGGMMGINLIETFGQVLGTGSSNQDFIANFYANGAMLSGVIEVPQKLDAPAYGRIKGSWNEAYGGPQNAGSTAVLEQGAKYVKVGLSPVEAGAGEAKKLVVSDVARITGVPQFLLEDLDRATFNNIEELGKMFVTYTVYPLVMNIEAELTRKLVLEREQDTHEIKADINSLLRANTEARAKQVDALMKWGIINRDEARKMEGFNPIPDGSGEAFYIPLNMTDPTKEPEEQPDTGQNESDDNEEIEQQAGG